MTSTLTERYIAAAVSSIPPTSRDDVQTELEVSIADAIEARTSQGEPLVDAERAVLTDLGDPGALAAGFTDRPLHLIGPRYYLAWLRLLKLLLVIVPIAAMGGMALAQALAQAPIVEFMTSVIATGLGATMHATFWVTLVFAVLERTGSTSAISDWDVDELPEIPGHGAGRGEMIAAIIFLVVGVGAILWDQSRGFVIKAGEVLWDKSDGLVVNGGEVFPFLNPGLWPWWITGLLVLMAAQTSLVVAIYLTRRWNAAFAIINTAIALAFAIPATALLATGQLVNPEFVTAVFTENGVNADTLRTLAIIAGAAIIGFSAWGIIEGWRKSTSPE